MNTLPYLKLGQIKRNRAVERLLPSEIAHQCHALPVSFDGKQITVAISRPVDKKMMSFLSTAIGLPVAFVQADIYEIDHRLDEIWHDQPEDSLSLLIWAPASAGYEKFYSFAERFAALLDAELVQADRQFLDTNSPTDLLQTIEEIRPDLVLVGEYGDLLSGKKKRLSVVRWLINKLPVSMVVTNHPWWPLKNILLILSEGNTTDASVVEWAGKLAQASRADVKILCLLPPMPLMYGQNMQYSIPRLLRSNDPLGKKIQWVSNHFSNLGIEGTFRLRQGDSECQIWSEISMADPDMIFVSDVSQNLAHRLLAQDTISALIKFTECPILFAQNT